MGKFCTNCGAAMENEDVFCGNCGAKMEEPVAPAVAQAPVTEYAPAKPTKKGKAKVWIAVVAAIVAVAAILIFVKPGKSDDKKKTANTYQTAIDNYVSLLNGNTEKLEKMAPKEYWQYMKDKDDDFDLDEMKQEYEENYDDYIEELEEEYGDNIKFSVKVTEKTELGDKKVAKIAKALEDLYEIDEESVKQGYELEVEATIKGSDDEDDEETVIYVIKIDSSWYLIYYYEGNDNVYVNFMVNDLQ